MATSKTYEAVISVLDRFSAPVLNLEEKLAKLGHVGEETNKRLQMSPTEKLWNELGEHVGEAREKFGDLAGSIGEMGSRLADILPMLGAVGGVGSAAGIFELAHATAEAAEALAVMSKITGVAVPHLQEYQFEAAQVGVTTDQLSLGLQKLNLSIGQAAEGKNKQAAELFHAMGISLEDAHGHMKTVTDILPQLESSFAKTKDPALRGAMAMALFGRSGEELLPFLTMGPKQIEELQAQFDKFGYKFSDKDQEGLEKFNVAWKDATLSVQGMANEIGAALAPVMAPLLVDFASFVAKNRDWIALDLKTDLTEVGQALQKIDVKTALDDFKGFVSVSGDVIDKIGGMKTVMIGAGAVMTLSFLAPVLEVTTALTGMGAKIASLALGPVAELGTSFVSLVPEIASAKDAMLAFDLALDANPIGGMILAAIALGGAAYYAYEHWDSFKAGMVEIFGVLDSVLKYTPFGFVVHEAVWAAEEIYKNWDKVPPELRKIWGDVEKDFEGAVKVIDGFIVSHIGQIKGLNTAWTDFEQDVNGVWTRIGTDFNRVFGPMEKVLDHIPGFDSPLVGTGSPLDDSSSHPALKGPLDYARERIIDELLSDKERKYGNKAAPLSFYDADLRARLGSIHGLSEGDAQKIYHEITIHFPQGAPPGTSVTQSTAPGAKPIVHNVGVNGTMANHRGN